MSTDPSKPQHEDPVPGANGVPQSDEEGAGQLDEQVTEDVGGVQGSAPGDDDDAGLGVAIKPGSQPDQPAPDAGEIEWAGQVVKKPPTPQS